MCKVEFICFPLRGEYLGGQGRGCQLIPRSFKLLLVTRNNECFLLDFVADAETAHGIHWEWSYARTKLCQIINNFH